MKKLLPFVLGLSLTLSACMPAFFTQTSNPTPTTAPSLAAPVEAPASPTPEILPTATQVPTQTAPAIPTHTNSPLPPTETTIPTLTNTPETVTPGAGTPTLTFTPVTFTATLGFQSYGTLPPLVPSGKLLLMNKSHAQAYISIQCVNKEGTVSIIEFPVGKWTETKAPAGRCDYVAWIGGRQFTGSFSLDTGGQRTITLYKNRIKIK